jgi:hypothetical protein
MIYVFDGGDAVPEWLDARSISVREPLSIYQAWNAALSLVKTPLVMNLNLDDRLAVDAVEKMENALLHEGASAVGGDWKVCYSQAEVDDIASSYPAETLPFAQDWPPRRPTLTRLGSGTGNRGTLGPSVLWRVDAHLGAPRYPWRLADGTIKTIGDTMWWHLLRTQRKKLLRLPIVIGNYHSHPAEQAEFRNPAEEETKLVSELGFIPF